MQEEFIEWLIREKGVKVNPTIEISWSQEEGKKVITREEIDKHVTLFELPRPTPNNTSRSPFLSIQTSELFTLLDVNLVSKNWCSLVLVLLWERVRSLLGLDRSWQPYFNLLPLEFDTLMFWSASELEELKGCTILKKIGKEEAEEDYWTIIKPVIESRPDLFPVPAGTTWEDNYGMAVYHRMGSLILSRSFNVQPWVENNHHDEYTDVSMRTSSSLDGSGSNSSGIIQEETHEDILLDDEGEPIEHITMLPLADLLNAKSGCENAKLFYETDSLKMKTTRKVKAGEQIYNTYGNPPNADLLRRYGHVDDPNRYDVVEISIQDCLETAHSLHSTGSDSDALTFDELKSRVEWAVEMGIDEVFELPTDLQLPEELTCILKILLLSKSEFQNYKLKQKLPKPKLNNAEVIHLCQCVLERRLNDYPTSIQEDEVLIKELKEKKFKNQSENRKIKAILVRKSEKEILMKCFHEVSLKLKLKKKSEKF